MQKRPSSDRRSGQQVVGTAAGFRYSETRRDRYNRMDETYLVPVWNIEARHGVRAT